MTVSVTAGALRIQAPAFTFVEGEVLDRLRDGRSVELEFILLATARSGGTAVTESHQVFNLSFDLWEERVAVTRVGKPPRSFSHLRPRDAEVWCLNMLMLPVQALAGRGRDTPFWVTLEYRVRDQTATAGPDDTGALSIRKLIDMLSRRRQDSQLQKSLVAGPFRLSGLTP